MPQTAGRATFDEKQAAECARAFAICSGLGCTVSDAGGTVFYEYGYGCASCGLCAAAGQSGERCAQSHAYGMAEAERFGGKYVYFCPMGLTHFVSPILGDIRSEARLTAGPFIMVEHRDFIDCELAEQPALKGEKLGAAVAVLERIPYVEPRRVTELSTLLSMAAGFLSNAEAERRMLNAGASGRLQEQISSYIISLKEAEGPPPYPFETERALLESITRGEKKEAQRLLNELLGAILFSGGGDLERIKSRVSELLVLISRTAIERGSDPEETLKLSHRHRQIIPQMRSIDELCFWLSGVMNQYMAGVFDLADARHADIIHRCIQHIGTNYASRLTLEETAGMVYLSPAYLSRIFKKETGTSFNEYLSGVRIGKAKELLRHPELRLTDIAQMVGYEDQSYFAKVFKRVTGSSPSGYRSGLAARSAGRNGAGKP